MGSSLRAILTLRRPSCNRPIARDYNFRLCFSRFGVCSVFRRHESPDHLLLVPAHRIAPKPLGQFLLTTPVPGWPSRIATLSHDAAEKLSQPVAPSPGAVYPGALEHLRQGWRGIRITLSQYQSKLVDPDDSEMEFNVHADAQEAEGLGRLNAGSRITTTRRRKDHHRGTCETSRRRQHEV